ncbi:tetratricopeptide repeat protein [Nostoc sp. UHCC 0251]|uniref:tetratricopeptide repeat protein n=1 Tax=Nostoc sp. UHCC 0251 TaxID=3110240 RepID=UPI002B20F11C|nr:tetratricopeptide repeat protein [Nostoc sp. UHCC 0251]MEA5622970.1 tetratricopeptide repeat protein [Nostoc sp. UHCC 0251]
MEIKLEQLVKFYERALINKPNNPQIYSQLSELYYAQGDLAAAIEAYQKAVQIQPDLEASNNTIQRLLLAQNQTQNNDSKLYNWITTDIESVACYPDVIENICIGKIDGILIKQVFSIKEMERVKEQIITLKNRTKTTLSWELIGESLTNIKGEIKHYYEQCFIFNLQLKEIFENNFEPRVLSVFNAISKIQTLELAKQNSEKAFIPAQIRILYPNSGGYKAHTEHELFEFYHLYEHLKPVVQQFDILSYFLVIDKPEVGGELILYDFLSKQTTSVMKKNFYTDKLDEYLEKFRKQIINPNIGDMVIFNGGRIWHKVADFDGEKQRISVGGLLACCQETQKIFCLT